MRRFKVSLWFLFLLSLISCSKRPIIVQEFSDSGLLYKEYEIDQDSLKHGLYLVYHDDGETLFEKSTYDFDLLHGKRTLFYSNGQIEIEEYYNHGLIIDTLYVYFANGSIQRKVPYEDGTIEGVLTSYYEVGGVKEHVTFSNNAENGPFVEYYKNGQIHWSGKYLNGDNEFGELLEFDSLGTLIKKMQCDSNAICSTTWKVDEDQL